MSIARSGTHALLAALIQQGLAVLHFLLLARWISPDALGAWAMFVTLTSFAEMMRMGLIQHSIIHFGTKNTGQLPNILTAGLVLNTVTNLVLAAVLFLMAWLLGEAWKMPELITLFTWYPFYALTYGFLRFGDAARMIHDDFKYLLFSSILFGSYYLIITVVTKLWIGNILIQHLILIQCLSVLLTIPTRSILTANTLQYGKFQWKWLIDIFQFGRYGMGTNLLSMLFQRVDMLLLGLFVTPVNIAIYNVATRLNSYLDLPLNSLGQAIYPKIIAESQRENGNVAFLYEQSVGRLLAITLPSLIAMIVLAKVFVLILAGKAYLDAVPIVQILALSCIVKPWGRMFGITLDAIGAPKRNFFMMLGSLIIMIIMNALLIPYWGITGAAVASVISIFITIMTGQMLIKQWLPVTMKGAIAQILPFYSSIYAQIRLRFIEAKKRKNTDEFISIK